MSLAQIKLEDGEKVVLTDPRDIMQQYFRVGFDCVLALIAQYRFPDAMGFCSIDVERHAYPPADICCPRAIPVLVLDRSHHHGAMGPGIPPFGQRWRGAGCGMVHDICRNHFLK